LRRFVIDDRLQNAVDLVKFVVAAENFLGLIGFVEGVSIFIRGLDATKLVRRLPKTTVA
jgi:hypothetical protein